MSILITLLVSVVCGILAYRAWDSTDRTTFTVLATIFGVATLSQLLG